METTASDGKNQAIRYYLTPNTHTCLHKHTILYAYTCIDEAVYRWNTRKASESERFTDMFNKSIGLVRKWNEIKVGLEAA